MFLHEIRAAINAEFANAPRPYSNDAELVAGIMELVADGSVTTLGPTYLFNKT